MIKELNSDIFKDYVKDGITLLDFYAPWCGPCKMLGPILEELSEKEGLKIGKINADTNEDICNAFNVTSIPVLMIFKDGKYMDRKVGFIPGKAIMKFVNLYSDKEN